ncbi:MAG: hypothetical protein KIT11_05490 [Fimbriimonadaceae bacterium]|nr:hypothetical protein [Fimbriimonadaceae bacterium]QYK56654.1 MAG: hypothetical protein KF733_04030 [Fimbriimonadaceae bacterium]
MGDRSIEAQGCLAEPGESFFDYCKRSRPHFLWHRPALMMIRALQAVADGETKNLIINVPPRVGKTEIVSRLFPAYFLSRYPALDVGIASYGAELAHDISKEARDLYLDGGGTVDPSMRSKRRWMTLGGGSCWAAGAGGAIRGRGYHVGICDDPHKDWEEVASDAKRSKVERWWPNTWENRRQLYTAFKPAQVVVMQRLAVNDLTGFLMAKPDAAKWTVLALDVVRASEPFPVPEGVRVVTDDRRPGEVIDPRLFSEERIKELMLDEDDWLAQFQQRPRPAGGAVFREEWFFKRCSINLVPPMLRRVMGVDLALTENTQSDYTCGIPIGFGADGLYYLFPPFWERLEAPDTEDGIARHARKTRCSVIAVEAVAYQLSFVQRMRRRPDLMGVSIVPVQADRDKLARAKGWSPMAAAGRFVIVEDGSDWSARAIRQLVDFPRGKKDLVDSIGIGLSGLASLASGDEGAVFG